MIKRDDNAIVNNCYCIKYSIDIPCDEQTEPDDYYIEKIIEQIPDDEEIFINGGGYPNNYGIKEFEIWTKKKEVIKQEKEIKKILKENGFKPFNIQINGNGSFVKINCLRLRFNKRTIETVCNLIKAKDWEVYSDDIEEALICKW